MNKNVSSSEGSLCLKRGWREVNEVYSILNHVIGPIMRGPSSSHTAASYFIGKIARFLLGDGPIDIEIAFDKKGSYVKVYREQGSDLAFIAGIIGLDLTDERFKEAINLACSWGISISFLVEDLGEKAHPNEVELRLRGKKGEQVKVRARSTGGGTIRITGLDGFPVDIDGGTYDAFLYLSRYEIPRISLPGIKVKSVKRGEDIIVHLSSYREIDNKVLSDLINLSSVRRIRLSKPVFLPMPGEPVFRSGAEVLKFTREFERSLGNAGIFYEAKLLGLSEEEVLRLMRERYEIMKRSVRSGLSDSADFSMKVLDPCAGEMFRRLGEKRLPFGTIHTDIGIRAMGVMHVCNSMGVVCAAPTAGSAGVIPAVLTALEDRYGIREENVLKGLFAAGVVGLIVAYRATFAAEEAGCQVEVGAAGAMAASAAADIMNMPPEEALDSAAISFHNSMGLICDPVGGFVEVPCHTRNAIFASAALVCVDLISGGYKNMIPFDETVDAVISVGRMLPRELRCTAEGGLSMCPSAMRFRRHS